MYLDPEDFLGVRSWMKLFALRNMQSNYNITVSVLRFHIYLVDYVC